MTSAPDICIYHANCDDGFAAAYVIWKEWGNAVEFVACDYKHKPPDVTGKDVLIVDFSFDLGTMLAMARQARRIIVLDHHKTARDALCEVPRCPVKSPMSTIVTAQGCETLADGLWVHFDMRKAGCRLAWEYVHGDSRTMPEWMVCVEDRDLWRFNHPDTKKISAALRSHPRKFEVWDRFSIFDLEREGRAIRRYIDQTVSNIADTAFTEKIGGHTVPVAACSYDFVSDVGHELLRRNPRAAFAACIIRTRDGTTYSLRSDDRRMDVSQIARAQGGGGHRNAAGFRVNDDV
ncbi:hypothetical protein [Oricola sp.]|uniref:hypothetical protein n=1 Tax=Oricola sp. TaxID=1979950 RepID=UPI003BA87540